MDLLLTLFYRQPYDGWVQQRENSDFFFLLFFIITSLKCFLIGIA